MRNKFRFARLDASENAFFERALNVVATRLFDTKDRELKIRQLIPVNNQVDAAASTYSWRGYSKVGMAKIIGSYADDLPRADVTGEENTAVIRSGGDSYGYNIMEIRQAKRAQVDLEQRKANAAKQAYDELLEIAWTTGLAAHNILGMFNQPNANIYTVITGAGGFLWTQKTAEEILADMLGIESNQLSVTKGFEKPDTLLLSLERRQLAATKTFDDATGDTVLRRFLALSENIKSVETYPGLSTAGSGNTQRMIAYRRDPDAIEGIEPQPFEQFPPEARGLEFVVACHGRIGPVVLYYPMSMSYGDGI